MNAPQILTALERERELLREFYALSEQQLVLIDDENLDGVNQLLDQRGDLMLELSAVEATLGTWIEQIKSDPSVSNYMLAELRSINDDIVQLANQVVDIDEQTHWRLDLIKQNAGTELRGLNAGKKALRGYEQALS
jgi:hypothetical protein